MQLLTGSSVAVEVHYSPVEDVGAVWDILANVTQNKCARVVHCRNREEGLIPNHGYSLLCASRGMGKDERSTHPVSY